MYRIEVFLPLRDNQGRVQPQERVAAVRRELLEAFGGLTAYSRAPAEGLWKDDSERPVRDEIVIVEVIAAELDRAWWQSYRGELESRFQQEQVLIRAQPVEIL